MWITIRCTCMCGKHWADWPGTLMFCTTLTGLWPPSVTTVCPWHSFLLWSMSAFFTVLIISYTQGALCLGCTSLCSWKSAGDGQSWALFPQCFCSIFSVATLATHLTLFPCLALIASSSAPRKLRQCRARAQSLLTDEGVGQSASEWLDAWAGITWSSPLPTLFSGSSRPVRFSDDMNSKSFFFKSSSNENVYSVFSKIK